MQGHVDELKSRLERGPSESQEAWVKRDMAVAEVLLAGYVRELQDLRDAYLKRYRQHVQDEEAWAARDEQMMKQAHQKMLQSSRERDSLRRRTCWKR